MGTIDLDSHPVESSLLYMLPLCGVAMYLRRHSGRWEAACAPHSARVDVGPARDGGKIEICTIWASILACIKVWRSKLATGCTMNNVHGSCRGVLAPCKARRRADHRTYFDFSTILIGLRCTKSRDVACLRFFMQESIGFYSLFEVFRLAALGLRTCGGASRGFIVHGARKRGARPLDAARSLTRLCYHSGQCVDGEGLVRCAGFKREEVMGCKPLHLGKG